MTTKIPGVLGPLPGRGASPALLALLPALALAACAANAGELRRREASLEERELELATREQQQGERERRFASCVDERFGADAVASMAPSSAAPGPPAASRGVALPAEALEEIAATFRRKSDRAAGCYTAELNRRGDRSIQGRLLIKLWLSEEGGASQVSVVRAGSTLNAAPVERCVVAELATWAFPRLPAGTWYTWPFDFRPAY